MTDLKAYAGIYHGTVEGWGIDLVMILTEGGNLYYLMTPDNKTLYLANHGTYTVSGNTLSAIVQCDENGTKVKQDRIHGGEKFVFEDEEYGDVVLNFVKYDGERPWEELEDSQGLQKSLGGSKTDGSQKSQEGSQKPQDGPQKPQDGPQQRPPRRGEPLPPRWAGPLRPVIGGPPPLTPEQEAERERQRQRERQERKERERREQEEYELSHPLRKLLFLNAGAVKVGIPSLTKSDSPNPANVGKQDPSAADTDTQKKDRFVYCLGHKQYFYVQGTTVTIYGLVALTDKSKAVALPLFFHAGAEDTIPWEDIVNSCAEHGQIDDFFIMNAYGDALKNALAKIRPKAKWFSMIFSVPSDAPLKKEAERLNREFDEDFKKFWRFKDGIENFDQAEAAANEYIVALKKFLNEKFPVQTAENIPAAGASSTAKNGQTAQTGNSNTTAQTAQTNGSNATTQAAQANNSDPSAQTTQANTDNNSSGKTTALLDKAGYAAGGLITVSVKGITGQMQSDKAFAAIYKKGAPHSDYGSYKYLAVGDSQQFFYAAGAHGEYEIRLYKKDGQYDDTTFVCSVGFVVGAVDVEHKSGFNSAAQSGQANSLNSVAQTTQANSSSPSSQTTQANSPTPSAQSTQGNNSALSASIEKSTYKVGEAINVSVTGVSKDSQYQKVFVAVYRKGVPHIDYGRSQQFSAGDKTALLRSYSLGEFEVRLYNKIGQYDDSTFVCALPFVVVE